MVTKQLHNPNFRSFASDNYAGVHPEILGAIAAANEGHQVAYGKDGYTVELQRVFTEHFGADAQTYPVFNGTGANVVGLQSMLPAWGAVICAKTAHINTDEAGAPEKVAGIKLLPVEAPGGKLTPALIDREAWGWQFEHRAQPLVVSISQSTELGTIYTVEEVKEIVDHAHNLKMAVHMDGARLANAAASLGVSLRALTADVGVDVLSFGGTKNGMLLGEAVVILNRGASEGLVYLRKLNMQLASKMRFISAQFLALLSDELWLGSATHANRMAARLRTALQSRLSDGTIRGIEFTQPTQANAVLATLPPGVSDRLRERFHFYDWDAERGEVRWMCSFDTTDDDVDALVHAICEELKA